MPVAIRKRSWEEHVTHPSGLQYSYDDLDLVCCHGVDGKGPWMVAGASKQGRRTRCASMPEGCHQLPTEDLAQTYEVTASIGDDDTDIEQLKLMGNNDEIPVGLQEESLHGPPELVDVGNIPQRESESVHLQTANMGNSGDCDCNSKMLTANLSCAADSSTHTERTINGEGEIGIEISQSLHICNDDSVLKRPHISREKQQSISISSNNGLPLSESAGDQSGKHPKHQDTKESHTEGYSRPPEISGATRNGSIAAELEPQTDLPDVEEETISTSEHAGANVIISSGVLHSSVDMMEDGDAMSPANTIAAADPVVTSVVDGESDHGVRESWSADSADKLDKLNDQETLNENTGLVRHSRDIAGGGERDHLDCTGVLDQAPGCEISSQTSLEKCNIKMTGMNRPQGEKRAQAGSSENAAQVRYGPIMSSDICFKGQCCSVTVTSNVSSEPGDTGNSEKDPRLTNITQCADQYVETTTSRSQTTEDVQASSVSKELSFSEDQTIAQLLENSSSKLDTILEVSCIEPDDAPALDLQKNINLNMTQNPDVQPSHIHDKHAATEQHVQNLPSCSAEVNDEHSPEGIHGNQSSGRYSSESPASEVADGQREHHRPGATVSRMEEADEAVHAVTYSDTHISSPLSDGTNKCVDLKEDSVVKVRMRKREHARLDSMVLLLMKLDQLDQEIENALSATASMDSTPTLHRRPLLESDLGSLPASQNPPHPSSPAASTSGPVPALGAKPKSGSTSAIPEKEKAEIEAKEACTWLRAAGFPQYAQLYEDALFPIDISSVTRDHDFLDRDAIEALCRRLNTLNKCALMRLEISPQRKRSEDSDEDEPCAISGRWTFQRDSKRWSRMEELEVFSSLSTDATQAPSFPMDQVSQKGKREGHLREGHSSESVLTDLSEQPEVGSIHSSGSGGGGEEKGHGATLMNEAVPAGATRASSVASMCSSSGTGGSGCANEDSLSDGLPPSPLETLGQFTFDMKTGIGGLGGSLDRGGGSGKSTRSRAKSFLKRMESLRLRSGTSSKRKKKASTSGGKIEISGPVIKEGLDDDKLRRLNCVDISSINLNQNLNHHRNPTQTMTLNRNRSVSYSTQASNGSTGSTGSSQSEASSGSAVSTPSPVTRARSHSTAAGSSKRGGMYLEGFDPFSILQPASDRQSTPPSKSTTPIPCQASNGMTVDEQNRRNNFSVRGNIRHVEEEEEEEEEEDGMIFFYLPEGHKPGTFPKALQDGSSHNNNGNDNGNSVVLRGRQSRRQHRGSSGSVDSRLSFYDNVPYTEREEEGEEEEGDEQKLVEALQHVGGLQRFNAWSEAVAGEEDEEEEDEEEEGDSDSALDSASPCPSSPLQNRLEETENGSDQDSTGNPLGDGEEGMRERRDSGVGASLTRSSRPQKLRWPSFQNSHRPSLASAQLQISCQSVLQMNLLQKLSLLQLTALLEKHTPTNKHGFSWLWYSAVKSVHRDMPKELRLQAARAAVLLLPDENREALRTLLCLLSDVTASVAENQMTPTNLAVCLAPSLFHLNTLRRKESSSPRVMNRKQMLGKPDQRDLNENLAATHGLAHMIQECRKLFRIPEEMNRCRNSYVEQALLPRRLEDLACEEAGQGAYRGYLRDSLDALLKEAKDKFRGYDSCSTPEHAELAYRKVHDGFPLRLWKVTVELPASPEEVLTRVLREQGHWDEDLLESRVLETLDEKTDVYQYVKNTMAPHPTRDHVVLRTWVTDLPKGACALVCTSVDHEGAPVVGVRANVLTSRYYIEPSGTNKSRLTHISRIDCRGRFPEWYNKLYGHLCASEVARIRDSLTAPMDK
nr:PREDICTED: rho GTPase-activating protein 7-like [Paralichthys olivaceus]